MENVNLWNLNPELSKFESDLNSIIETIKKEKITYIKVIDEEGMEDGKEPTYFVSNLNEKAKECQKKVKYVDDAHPFMIDCGGNVYFERNFFESNKDILLKSIYDNLFEKNYVNVSKYIYSDELAIELSKHAKNIVFDEGIVLSDQVVELYKKLRIDSYCYINGNKVQVSSSRILGCDYYDVVSEDKESLHISSEITDLENLKYIPENKTIIIKNRNMFDEGSELQEDYDSYYNIVSKLRENGQNNKIIIQVKNRKLFSKSKLYNSNYDITIDGIDSNKYTLDELKAEDKLLDLMVRDIKDSKYSPFEKYIAVYNIVKKFKDYLENENDKTASRKISKLLNNEYMVCVGYANLLIELLGRVGINAYGYDVAVDTSYDNGFTQEEIPTSLAGHERVIVDISDDKYNISGYYVSDPTWDNDLTKDYYNHALMTFDKTSTGRRYLKLDDIDLILNSSDINDYDKRINFILDRKKGTILDEMMPYKMIYSTMMNLLAKLYPEKCKEILNKYPELYYDKNPNIAYQFIKEVGKFFLSKKGKEVPMDTILDAACNVNKEVFNLSYEQTTKSKEELLEDNLKREQKVFPYYLGENTTKKI